MQEDGINVVDLLCQLRSLDKVVEVDKDHDKSITKTRSTETLSLEKGKSVSLSDAHQSSLHSYNA